MNAAACASLGYAREELLTLRVPDIEAGHTEEGFRFWRELSVGSTEKFEGLHRRKDRRTFPVEDRLRPHWRFLSAQEGPSGLRLAREQRPDVVLLDLQIPGMGGDAVLTELRADPATRHLPVLMLSADATSKSRERLLAMGANGYLAKPFNVTALLERIGALLRTA